MKQLLAHLIGDYILQSHWMAVNKNKNTKIAVAHGLAYSLPFVVLCKPSKKAWFVITSTHIVIDRFGLGRYVVWAKNQLVPKSERFAPTPSGSPLDTPRDLAGLLLILTDNIMHGILNAMSMKWLK